MSILHQLDLITRYIYANGQKISSWTRYRYRQTGRLDGNTKEDVPLGEFFYHDNHLGSSVLITDKQGKEKTRILYKPFGEIDQSHSVGLNATTMKFTSQELDEESGLYYYRSRFYDPSLGRFLNPDSIIPDWYDSQAFNRYAYALGNPIRYIDPTGHSSISAFQAMAENFYNDFIKPSMEGIHGFFDQGRGAGEGLYQLAGDASTLSSPFTPLEQRLQIQGSYLDGIQAIANDPGLLVDNIRQDIADEKYASAGGRILFDVTALASPFKFSKTSKGSAPFSPMPESYYSKTIDMSSAPASSATNAAGFPRNDPWFWREVQKANPEMFDVTNKARIRSGRSPTVNDQWIQHNPTHQNFKGEKLIHHHIDQGPIATGLPEVIHHKWNTILHLNRGR